MIVLGIAIAMVLSMIGSWVLFHPEFKETSWTYWVTLAFSLINTVIWIGITKVTLEAKQLLMYAIYWDVGVILTALAVPLIFFGAKLNLQEAIGLVLIIIGLFTLKF
jgi:multidrug transporter EmrE-like cation transporter